MMKKTDRSYCTATSLGFLRNMAHAEEFGARHRTIDAEHRPPRGNDYIGRAVVTDGKGAVQARLDFAMKAALPWGVGLQPLT